MMLLLTYRLEELSDAGHRRALFADMNAHFEDPALSAFLDRVDGLLITGEKAEERLEEVLLSAEAVGADLENAVEDRDYYKTLLDEARARENSQTATLLRWAQLFKEHGIDP
jgi:hypothetical protein